MGYDKSENTWIGKNDLIDCKQALHEFEQRQGRRKRMAEPRLNTSTSAVSASPRPTAENDFSAFAIIESHYDQTNRWNFILCNAKGPPISVYNDVDDCGPPLDFTYIDENMYHPSAPSFDRTFMIGCECKGSRCALSAGDVHCDCTETCGRQIPYDKYGRLKHNFVGPIYECNSKCLCDPNNCGMRIVQRGLRFRLQIYRTSNNCGWGVRTLEQIPSGSFVAKYTGEVITDKEAERRGMLYDFIGRTYLFDIDGLLDDEETGADDEDDGFGRNQTTIKDKDDVDRLTIDAFHYGNISRFFNHSCDPTLTVFACFIENQDPRCHEVTFFANRDINAGEDLTFDYTGGKILDSDDATYVKCYCGSRKCRVLVAM